MSVFFELIRSHSGSPLAVVGMTKNVGKTVTLNFLVRRYAAAGKTLGLVSAGYDGERFDRLTLKEKPRIHAPAGAVVATARACFESAAARLDLLERTRVATPLGEVCLGRVSVAGTVELAGPGSAGALRQLVEKMKEYGAGPVLVDGAINRLASAAPAVTGAAVLASGAAVGSSLADVARKTLFRCSVLQTPRVAEAPLLGAAEEGLRRGEAVLLRRDGAAWQVEPLRAPIPLLVHEQIIKGLHRDTAAVALGGALVDRLAVELISRRLPAPPLLIVRDATKVFLSPEGYDRFRHYGGALRVLREIDLVAVTLNPTDPGGAGFEPRPFLEYMTEALAPCPVFDLVLQEGASS